MCGDNNESKGDILLCDSCDAEYHLSCCTPPLAATPEGEWYCLTCRERRGEPVSDLLAEVSWPGPSRAEPADVAHFSLLLLAA